MKIYPEISLCGNDLNGQLSYKSSLTIKIKERIKLVINLIVNYVKFIFNMMRKNDEIFRETDSLSDEAMEKGRVKFNAQSHNVYVLSCAYSEIETAKTVTTAMNKFYTSLGYSLFANEFSKKIKESSTDSLMQEIRSEIPKHKEIIVFPLVIYQRHWTSVQVDLRSKRIYYLDSLGKGFEHVLSLDEKIRKIDYYDLIWTHLEGIKFFMDRLYPDEATFAIYPEKKMLSNGKLNSPSAIRKVNQYDLWNCGAYIFHYGLVASELQKTQKLDPALIRQPFYETTRSILEIKKWMSKELNSSP